MSSHHDDVLSFLKKQSQLLAKFTLMDNEAMRAIQQVSSIANRLTTGSEFISQIQKSINNSNAQLVNQLIRDTTPLKNLYTTAFSELLETPSHVKSITRIASFLKPVDSFDQIKISAITSSNGPLSLEIFKQQQKFIQSIQHRPLAELFNTRSLAVAQFLEQHASDIDIKEGIGSLLEKRYGLNINDTCDAISPSAASTAPLPNKFRKLSLDKALDQPEVQRWFKNLSGHARTAVYVIIIHWFLAKIMGGIANDIVMDTIKCHLPANIVGECTSRKVRKEIQNTVSPENYWENLTNFRLIRKNKVSLRSNPAENAPILEILPANTLLLIVDKSNRQWLEVEVEYGGERIRGWVARRYTLPLHKH